MYLSMRKKNSKKKKREDLPSLSHLGERFSIYLSMRKKNSKKRQRRRIYFYPCQRKTSMEQEKFKEGEGWNDFPYIYRWNKNSKKRQRRKIYHPCRRKTPWRTIFHIFIDVNIPYIYRVKIWQRDREGRFTILVEERHWWSKKNSTERRGLERFFIYLSIGKKFERGRGRIYHLSLFYLEEWFFIYLSMGKKSKKRQKGKIYHPCWRKTPWRTIFHIFIV